VEEFVVNLHIHSSYSDGTWSHQKIAEAGINSGVDGIIITDHNILVHNLDGYYHKNGKKILVMVGEEIHNKNLEPQKNHLITFGQNKELCEYADNTQLLINQVKKNGGLSFLAHPFEKNLPQVNEPEITWDNWNVEGFNGIEIWNHLSELKNESRSWPHLIFNILFPYGYARGPHPMSLKKWDELLMAGKKIIAVGGSDAHRLVMKKGLLEREIFPYAFHFNAINNHLLVRQPLSGDYPNDRKIIVDAFKSGNSYVGYDLPASTKGFRFYAQGKQATAIMGEEIELNPSITFQIRVPEAAECRLIHNGNVLEIWKNQEICTYITKSTGIYRVECYIQYFGKKRGWIFSNPIFVSNKRSQV